MKLKVTRAEAHRLLDLQLGKGSALAAKAQDNSDMTTAISIAAWSKENTETLRFIYETETPVGRYLDEGVGRYSTTLLNAIKRGRLGDNIRGPLHSKTLSMISKLEFWQQRLPLATEPQVIVIQRHEKYGTEPLQEPASPDSRNRAFIVHGHNNEIKETTARFLEKLGVEVEILHEQADRGRTVIEKFEAHSKVDFAVVLITADDIGASKASPKDLLPRGRQNVILELGYFLGTLGRQRVSALLEEGVEVPSDLSGILYTPIDANGAWKTRLAAEMKAAGLAIDMNRAL